MPNKVGAQRKEARRGPERLQAPHTSKARVPGMSGSGRPFTLESNVLLEFPVIDPRGTRFAAAITVLVLAAVILLAPGPVAAMLLAWQTMVFAMGAILGPSMQPYGWLFKILVRPRLKPPAHMEDALPPQFAQAIGLGFALAASISMLFAWTLGVWVFAGFALFAAALNAIFGFCLGCEIYLRIQRFLPQSAIPPGQRRMDESALPLWTFRPQAVDATEG